MKITFNTTKKIITAAELRAGDWFIVPSDQGKNIINFVPKNHNTFAETKNTNRIFVIEFCENQVPRLCTMCYYEQAIVLDPDDFTITLP